MRLAVLAHNLKNSKDSTLNNFVLVLPPWSHLIHWGYSEEPEYIPWSKFFDLSSLQKFAPVMELHEYFRRKSNWIFEASFKSCIAGLQKNKYTKCVIDRVYILQHYDDMFESGKFEEKWNVDKCSKPPKLRFFYYSNITSYNVQCVSFHGPATKLAELLKQDQSK